MFSVRPETCLTKFISKVSSKFSIFLLKGKGKMPKNQASLTSSHLLPIKSAWTAMKHDSKSISSCSGQFSTSPEIMTRVLLPKGTPSGQRLLHRVQHGHMRKLQQFHSMPHSVRSHSPGLSTNLESSRSPEAPASDTKTLRKDCRFYIGYSLAARSL